MFILFLYFSPISSVRVKFLHTVRNATLCFAICQSSRHRKTLSLDHFGCPGLIRGCLLCLAFSNFQNIYKIRFNHIIAEYLIQDLPI